MEPVSGSPTSFIHFLQTRWGRPQPHQPGLHRRHFHTAPHSWPPARLEILRQSTDQGTAWRAPGFNDNSWASGAAQLGYGEGDEATVISYGPNANAKYTTTYFRRAFNVTDVTLLTNVTVSLLRDDGGIVYLNGVEIFRSNMPAGAVTYTTFASSVIDDQVYFSSRATGFAGQRQQRPRGGDPSG